MASATEEFFILFHLINLYLGSHRYLWSGFSSVSGFLHMWIQTPSLLYKKAMITLFSLYVTISSPNLLPLL